MQVDYILVGAGGAGFSLLHHLLSSPLRNASILVIDREAKTQNDRTWCFWSEETPRYQSARSTHWDHLCFHGIMGSTKLPLQPYTYYHLRSADFYAEVKEMAAQFPNVTFLQAAVESIEDWEDGVRVQTQEGYHTGQYLFDSRPIAPATNPHSARETTLAQNFTGWRIQTPLDAFDPSQFTLMDFRHGNQRLPTFYYVLPFSKREALVEVTQFSPNFGDYQEFSRFLHSYIQQTLGVAEFAIREEEEGCIPMTTYPFPDSPSKRVFRLGTAGGDTKPTTGYTFQNIQKHCARLVEMLQGKGTSGRERPAIRYSFLDRLLLHIMREEPQQVAIVMESLFRANTGPRILRFLDQETTLLEEARMVSKLPWKPFLRALFFPKPQNYSAHVEVEASPVRHRLVYP